MASGGARLVAAGILASRIVGLLRQRLTAQVFGAGPVGDALAAAFRIPNLLQNLFGEGALSAAFIPVYARLVAEGRTDLAGRVAGATFGLLAAAMSVLVLVGTLAAPWLVALLAPGLAPETRALTTVLVRIVFPGIGILVLSAWALGVLNAHRRFLLSYASPVLWNLAIIVALLVGLQRPDLPLAQVGVWVAMASVVGCVLQFLVQVPTVWRLAPQLRLAAGEARASVREVVRNFVPASATRGVVQVSAWVDTILASLLGAGALATLSYAQALTMLPVSLFGMSVAASELPAMSEATGDDATVAEALRARLTAATQRVAFFVVPSAMAFLALGAPLARALFGGGAFTETEARWVWAALAGAAVGLLAGTLGRLYSSALFALRDTRTPFRFAMLRVTAGAGLGAALALSLPGALGVATQLGVGALTAASGIAAWAEFWLLRRAVVARIGAVHVPMAVLLGLWGLAAVAALAGVAVDRGLPAMSPVLHGIAVCGAFGLTYLALARLTGLDRARRA